jgi:hypothetical protein
LLMVLRSVFERRMIRALIFFVLALPPFIFGWDMFHAMRLWQCKVD